MANKNINNISFGSLALVFPAILFMFVAITASHTDTNLQNQAERKLVKSLEVSLDQVIRNTSKQSFVQLCIDELLTAARNHGINSDEFSKISDKISNEKGLKFNAYLYENRALKKYFGIEEPDLKLFEQLMQALTSSGDKFAEAQRHLHDELLKLFGSGNRLELIQIAKGAIKRLKTGGTNQFYLWDSFDDGFGIFFITTEIPDFIERFSCYYSKSDSFGAGDPSQSKIVAPSGISENQMMAAKIKAGLEGKNSTLAFDRFWYFIDDESGTYWARTLANYHSNISKPMWARYIFLASALLCCVFALLYLTSTLGLNPGLSLCDWLDSVSLRYRIMSLFFVASAFPVIITLLIGTTSLIERAEVIESQVVAESISSLQRIERMYRVKINDAQNMAKALREAVKQETPSRKMLDFYIDKYQMPSQLTRLEVRDINGALIYTTDDRKVHGVTIAMDIFSKLAMKLHIPSRLGAAIDKISPAEIVSESVLSTDEIGMATLIRQRGKQWYFRMGTFPTLWYWDVYPEIASGPAFINTAAQLESVHREQIKREFSGQSPENPTLELAVQLNSTFSRYSVYPKINEIDQNFIINSALASFRSGKVVFRETSINNRPYWVVIKPDKNLGISVFANMVSQEERLKVLLPIKWQMVVGGFFALIISLLGAGLISNLIIKPIGDLYNGVEAIVGKNDAFRIPVRRNDEFGALATAFNNVISEFKELQYGRLIQESLLPGNIQSPEGYDLACFYTSATDLAGDYHDVLTLDDGRVAIILGDVTGHGISASLAMAMAKATVDYLKLDGCKFPSYAMDSLNALFNKELKPRSKFMTLVTMVLRPDTGELEVVNAGQSFPRYFRAAENCSHEIEIPSMPLGAMKKRRAKPESRQMQSGDGILLYSDGIVECSDETNDMFGYKRLQQLFDELMRQNLSSVELLRIMMETLDNFRVPGPYPDDITLVMLKKL